MYIMEQPHRRPGLALSLAAGSVLCAFLTYDVGHHALESSAAAKSAPTTTIERADNAQAGFDDWLTLGGGVLSIALGAGAYVEARGK